MYDFDVINKFDDTKTRNSKIFDVNMYKQIAKHTLNSDNISIFHLAFL